MTSLNIFEVADLFKEEVMIVTKAEKKLILELRDRDSYKGLK